MTLTEFIEEANKMGIVFRTNPSRTIRYYIRLGILTRPAVKQMGQKRQYDFTQEHLMQLSLIHDYKSQGYTLAQIKELMFEPLYWSDEGISFITPYLKEHNVPPENFRSGKPVSREESAVFFHYAITKYQNEKIDLSILDRAFVDKKGKPPEIPKFIQEKL